MNFFKKIFSKPDSPFPEFSKLSPNNRMRMIMQLGDKGDMQDFNLMAYAIQTDTDMGVRMAGLKRIHAFKNHPDLKPLLLKLKDDGVSEGLEPYYSMALSKTGIITFEEFTKKING